MTDVERFCAEHHDGVYRYLRRVVGAAESARDLTQEVFLRVSRAGVPEANDIGRRAWLFRIARNLALNHLRDGRRRPPTVTFGSAAVPATQELAVALSAAIDALPDLDRDIFLLRETAGLSYEEIAAASEVPLESVRSRLHRARQALRAALGHSLALREQRGVRCLPAGTRDGDDR